MSKVRSFTSLLALDKISRAMRIISSNGGLIRSLFKLWRMDTLKEGKLMGQDAFGNKYYENHYYMMGRSRWVEYNPQFKFEYDASQVTPEWYGWLHYKTDRLPGDDCAKLCLTCCTWCHVWLQPHAENLTNTTLAYYPYSTTRNRVHLWDGNSICTRDCDD